MRIKMGYHKVSFKCTRPIKRLGKITYKNRGNDVVKNRRLACAKVDRFNEAWLTFSVKYVLISDSYMP